MFTWGGNPIANFAARITTGVAGNTVAIRRDVNTVVVEWTGLSILQVSDSAGGPFTDQPNFRNRYEFNPVGAPMKFWRLRD